MVSNSSAIALKFRESIRGTEGMNIKRGNEEHNGDLILETYRRSEFILFLINSANINERPKPNLMTVNQFRIDDTHIIDFDIGKKASDDAANQLV